MVIAAITATWIGLSLPVSFLLSRAMRSESRQLVGVEGPDAVYLLDNGSLVRATLHSSAA